VRENGANTVAGVRELGQANGDADLSATNNQGWINLKQNTLYTAVLHIKQNEPTASDSHLGTTCFRTQSEPALWLAIRPYHGQ